MSYTKKVLLDYAKSYGVRKEDIVEYAKNYKGCVSKDNLLKMAKEVETFQESHDKTNSVKVYAEAVQVLGILYAACDKLGLEGGELLDRDTKRALIYSTVGFFAFVTLFVGLLFGNRILNICNERSQQAIKDANMTARAYGRNATSAAETALEWTGIVTAIVVLPVTIAAVLIFRK